MASRSVNKVILLGHLGRDAEIKYTPNGASRCTFTLATSRRWKDQQTGEWKEETDWHNVVLWRSENVAPHLQKGKQVYVEGRLQTRSWEDKDGNKRYTTEIIADNLILLGGRGGEAIGAGDEDPASASASGPRSAGAGRGFTAAPQSDMASQEISDDDVPF
ncbi:MAG TPA: single-stranded DNA-binding protein [Bryobacterales bacterium]|jgi:single-strand DNA-binding protein|nr:single-stranded DNA-binding protein [Bryobacterales bacterium]